MTEELAGKQSDVPGAEAHREEETLDSLYRDVIFEHYRRPHNKGTISEAQIVTKGNNPVCGDRVTVFGKVSPDGRLEQVAFEGKGCAICMACSSMMTEAVRGKTLAEAAKITDRFKAMMRNEVPFEPPTEVPDMEALEGVRKFSVRVKCATLSWTTLKNGIVQYSAAHGGKLNQDAGTAMNQDANPTPAAAPTPQTPSPGSLPLGSTAFQTVNGHGQDARATNDTGKMPVPQQGETQRGVPETPAPAAPPQPATSPPESAREAASAPAASGDPKLLERIRDGLKDVYDPEIPINIVDLGLIYKLEEKDGDVAVDMTLTSPHCPIGDQIKSRVEYVVTRVEGVKNVKVNLVFDPLWTKDSMTFDGKLQASMLGFM